MLYVKYQINIFFYHILKFVKFYPFLPLIGPQKGPAPIFFTNLNSLHQWIRPAKFLEKKSFKEKVYGQQMDRQIDETVSDTYSSLEHSAKVS